MPENEEYSPGENAGENLKENPGEDLKFDPNGDYLTVAEAAAILGINTQSCRNAFVHGNLKGVAWYGRVLIPRAALEEYKQRTQPDGKPPGPGRPKKSQ